MLSCIPFSIPSQRLLFSCSGTSSMLPHLVRLSSASEIIPLHLEDVKRFFHKFYESTKRASLARQHLLFSIASKVYLGVLFHLRLTTLRTLVRQVSILPQVIADDQRAANTQWD